MAKYRNHISDYMDVVKALADENRIRALLALRGRELCVCQIIELLGLAPSTVSKHMSVLRQARLVEGRKNGRWMFYRFPKSKIAAPAGESIDWVCRTFAELPEVRRDAEMLKRILTHDPQELCKKQLRRPKGRQTNR